MTATLRRLYAWKASATMVAALSQLQGEVSGPLVLTTLLGQDAFPTGQHSQDHHQNPRPAAQLHTGWAASSPLALLAEPAVEDFPSGRHGGDIPPNPTAKPYAISLRTWTQNLLQSTLDEVFVQPSGAEWPNPRVKVQPHRGFVERSSVDLLYKTHVHRTPLYLRHLAKPFDSSLRTHVQNLILTTLATPEEFPTARHAGDDQPNPQWPKRATSLLTHTWSFDPDTQALQEDFPTGRHAGDDQPNPQWKTPPNRGLVLASPIAQLTAAPVAYVPRVPIITRHLGKRDVTHLRQWPPNNNLLLFDSGIRYQLSGSDWKNPQHKPYPAILRTWAQTLLPRTPPPPPVPLPDGRHSVDDQQNPRWKAVRNRGWVASSPLPLLLEVPDPIPIGHHSTFDQPNPRVKPYPVSLRTHTLSLSTSTLFGQDQFFGLAGNPTWPVPNPRYKAQPTLTWTQSRVHILTIQPADPLDLVIPVDVMTEDVIRVGVMTEGVREVSVMTEHVIRVKVSH